MYINTNVSALFAENSLNNTQNTLNTLQQEMSTGYQINSPSNNPSGLAIANLMSGELGAINSATNNATEASNLLNTANGGMQTDIQIVQQIQQLAVQASNSTNNAQDTADIQGQIQQLLVSLDNVGTTLNYNNQAILNQGPTATIATGTIVAGISIGADTGALAAGASYAVQISYATVNGGEDVVTVLASTSSGGNATLAFGTIANLGSTAGTISLQLVSGYNSSGSGSDSFIVNVNQAQLASAAPTSSSPVTAAFTVTQGTQYEFQTGPNQGSGDVLQTSFGSFSSATLGLSNLNVTSAQGAQYAISQAQSALSLLTNAQSAVGSQIDQINYTITNLQTEGTNLQASQASIMDANMAQVTSQFAQTQILEQTGIQALTTAQQLPSMVLKLLG